MAIVNNGTVNSLPSTLLPSDYTRPTVTLISDYDYVNTLTLSVLKATVDDSDKATTVAAIIAHGTVGITQQIDDILAADFLATATVTAYAELVAINSNIELSLASDFFNDTAVSYVCTVKLYVKAA